VLAPPRAFGRRHLQQNEIRLGVDSDAYASRTSNVPKPYRPTRQLTLEEGGQCVQVI